MLCNEFDRRIEQVRRDVMAPHGIDLLLVYGDDVFRAGNVRYLTNFDVYANYGMVIVPRAGDVSLTFGFHHSAYLVRVKEVARAGYIKGTKTPENHCRELMRGLGIAHPRIGLVGAREMFQSMAAGLEKAFAGGSFQDVTADFARLRSKKSKSEMACIARSARIADRSLSALKEHLRAGNTERKLVTEAGLAARCAGADVLTREMVGFLVASGEAVRRSLGPATERVLCEGDAFAVEISPQFEGYRAVLGRTLAAGTPSQDQRAFTKRAAATHRRVCAFVKPGMRASDLARAAREALAKEGLLEHARRALGHGIGLDLEEPPRLDERDATVLEAGTALVVRTALVWPQKAGAFFADTVVVGEDSAATLSRMQTDGFSDSDASS